MHGDTRNTDQELIDIAIAKYASQKMVELGKELHRLQSLIDSREAPVEDLAHWIVLGFEIASRSSRR